MEELEEILEEIKVAGVTPMLNLECNEQYAQGYVDMAMKAAEIIQKHIKFWEIHNKVAKSN